MMSHKPDINHWASTYKKIQAKVKLSAPDCWFVANIYPTSQEYLLHQDCVYTIRHKITTLTGWGMFWLEQIFSMSRHRSMMAIDQLLVQCRVPKEQQSLQGSNIWLDVTRKPWQIKSTMYWQHAVWLQPFISYPRQVLCKIKKNH